MRYIKIFIILSMFVSILSSDFSTDQPLAKGINIITTESSNCDWASFTKNPEGNRIASDGCGPFENNPQVLWSFKTNSRIWTTPVVANNKTYIRTDTNNLYCVDVRTGKQKWLTNLGDVASGTNRSSSSTACIYDNKVYIGSYDKKMYCIDADTGKKIWSILTDNSITSSPVVYDGKIYFGSNDKRVYCANPQTGELIWTYKTGYSVFSSATFIGDKMYIGSMDSRLYCLNKDNGNKFWDLFVGENNPIESSPTISNNKIFYATRGGSVLCIDSTRGIPQWKKIELGEIRGSLLVLNNRIYFCAGAVAKASETKLHCLNANDGSKVWEKSFRMNKTNGSSVVSYGSKIVFTGSDDKLYILDAANGSEISNYKIPDSSPNTYPVVFNKMILVSSYNNTLYCFGDGNAFEPPVPNKVEIIAPFRKVDPCFNLKLSAKILDQYGEIYKSQEVAWSVDNPEFGTIDNEGLFTPAKKGKVKILCQVGKITESVEIEILDFLSFDKQTLSFENLEPDKLYTQTVTLTSFSDSSLLVTLSSDFEKFIINPAKVTIEPNDPKEVKITYTTKNFKPGEKINFKLLATYGKCAKEVSGLITCVSTIVCLITDKQAIDFGYVKRGETKSVSLILSSENPINVSITTENPWLTISKTDYKISKEPTEISFTVIGSALPAKNKLTSKITIKSETTFCTTQEIPVNIETDTGIILKLQVDSKKAFINDMEKTLDAPPAVINGRTMVPLRFISEAFGCGIDWKKDEQKISITRYDMSIVLWVGKNQAEINGQKLKIDSPPVIVGSRTMVPLRFIAEPFGAKVDWNAQTKQITIVWPKP